MFCTRVTNRAFFILFDFFLLTDPLVINSYMQDPFDEVFRLPGVYKCRPLNLWKAWHFVFHLIPGFFADCLLRLQGKKPR